MAASAQTSAKMIAGDILVYSLNGKGASGGMGRVVTPSPRRVAEGLSPSLPTEYRRIPLPRGPAMAGLAVKTRYFASARSRKSSRSCPQNGSPLYTYQGAPKTWASIASCVNAR